jgi:hypothetical protein
MTAMFDGGTDTKTDTLFSPDNCEVVTPSTAWIPPTMSLTALAIVITHIALYGIAREAEGDTSSSAS